MIVIITNDDDHSTNKIIEWMEFFGAEYKRVNEGIQELSLKSIIIERDGKICNNIPILNFLKFNVSYLTFFRRGHIWSGYSVTKNFGNY